MHHVFAFGTLYWHWRVLNPQFMKFRRIHQFFSVKCFKSFLIQITSFFNITFQSDRIQSASCRKQRSSKKTMLQSSDFQSTSPTILLARRLLLLPARSMPSPPPNHQRVAAERSCASACLLVRVTAYSNAMPSSASSCGYTVSSGSAVLSASSTCWRHSSLARAIS